MRPNAYIQRMSKSGLETQLVPSRHRETRADRLSRIEREEAVIAKAEADIDAGRGIDDDALEQWFDALDRDENTPLPTPHTGPAFR